MISRAITAVVIHCAATKNGQPFHVGQIDAMHGQPVYDKAGVKIREHRFQRNPTWVKKFNPALRYIGYHYFIGVDGARATGRHLDEIGAHVQGSNAHSIGICMAGTDRFTALQWTALKWLMVEVSRHIADGKLDAAIQTPDEALAAMIQLNVSILGHRDYSPDLDGDGIIEPFEWLKTCPGFDVAEWMRRGMAPLPGHVL